MARVDDLIKNVEHFARLPWQPGISGAERVWFAVYDPPDERRVRCRLGEFANAINRAGHEWSAVDLTDSFAQWMAEQDYREAYFESPEDMTPLMTDLNDWVANRVTQTLSEADSETVVAMVGPAGLFSFLRVSELLDDVADSINGRLMVFFPGTYAGNVFRLLDARDGWNYRAIPITA